MPHDIHAYMYAVLNCSEYLMVDHRMGRLSIRVLAQYVVFICVILVNIRVRYVQFYFKKTALKCYKFITAATKNSSSTNHYE